MKNKIILRIENAVILLLVVVLNAATEDFCNILDVVFVVVLADELWWTFDISGGWAEEERSFEIFRGK